METTTKNFKNINDIPSYKAAEKLLEEVMEVTDPRFLENKLVEVENLYKESPNEINKTKMGIIYHEVALYSSFYSKNKYKGFAKKSYNLLGNERSESLNPNLKPFQDSYKASALALIGAETKNLFYVGKSFKEFEIAVDNYSEIIYLPEFLRGSVAEKIPWFFFSKKKFAKKDFESIVRKYQADPEFASDKIMSFVYYGLALQTKGKKEKKLCLDYLDKAIASDPIYNAAGKKAQQLKLMLH